jgi:hypothetical protein
LGDEHGSDTYQLKEGAQYATQVGRRYLAEVDRHYDGRRPAGDASDHPPDEHEEDTFLDAARGMRTTDQSRDELDDRAHRENGRRKEECALAAGAVGDTGTARAADKRTYGVHK